MTKSRATKWAQGLLTMPKAGHIIRCVSIKINVIWNCEDIFFFFNMSQKKKKKCLHEVRLFAKAIFCENEINMLSSQHLLNHVLRAKRGRLLLEERAQLYSNNITETWANCTLLTFLEGEKKAFLCENCRWGRLPVCGNTKNHSTSKHHQMVMKGVRGGLDSFVPAREHFLHKCFTSRVSGSKDKIPRSTMEIWARVGAIQSLQKT